MVAILLLVAGLLSMGALKSNVDHNTKDIESLRDSISDALKEMRKENKRDHERILDRINELEEKD